MKKWIIRIIGLLMLVVWAFVLLAVVSHREVLRIENEVLKPCLSSSRAYNRVVRFGLFDPWVSMLPHWTVSYFENPTDRAYDTPSVTINIFSQVVDCSSKGVPGMLVEKGYRDDD